MTRNLGVLLRKGLLVCNRNQHCFPGLVHHHRKLLSNSIQTLTLTPIPGTNTPQFTPPPRNRNLHFKEITPPPPPPPQNLDFKEIKSPFISILRSGLGLPSNLFVLESSDYYYVALKKVEDKRISAVFFYTARRCWLTFKWITPTFRELCDQFQHIRIYMVYLEQNGDRHQFTLRRLGVKSPTFHFYLNGKKVDELASASVPRLKKTFANVYNPSGMKKRRTQAKKDKDDGGVDLSQLVEVLPSSFPASSIPKMMEAVESLPGGANEDLWFFAKGLFSSQEKREMFSGIEDPYLKLEWLKREMDLE